MDSNHPLRITQSEALHQRVMQQILDKVQDTPYVLKGGTALLFTRNLDRHSTDLDFDSAKQINIEGRIRDGLKAADVELKSLKKVKDTATVQRYKIHYLDPVDGQDRLLKVETSFRQQPKAESIEVVNGIRTYAVGYMFDLKMDAAENRTEARDLYDLAHLLREYGNQLSSVQIVRAEAFSHDMDGLVALYSSSFETDDVLKKLTNIDDTVIAFREAVEQQMQREDQRLALVPQQAIAPSSAQQTLNESALKSCWWLSETFGEQREDGAKVWEAGNFIFTAQQESLSVFCTKREETIL